MPARSRAAAAAATVFLVLAPAAPAGAAAPQPPAGPPHGRLYLSVSDETDGETRGAMLTCPGAGGEHPRAAEACAALDRSGGRMHLLAGREGPCTMDYTPVTATASGTWRGRSVTWHRTFPNACALTRSTGPLFDF